MISESRGEYRGRPRVVERNQFPKGRVEYETFYSLQQRERAEKYVFWHGSWDKHVYFWRMLLGALGVLICGKFMLVWHSKQFKLILALLWRCDIFHCSFLPPSHVCLYQRWMLMAWQSSSPYKSSASVCSFKKPKRRINLLMTFTFLVRVCTKSTVQRGERTSQK